MRKKFGCLSLILLLWCSAAAAPVWGFGPRVWLREDFHNWNPAWETRSGTWTTNGGYLTGVTTQDSQPQEAALGFNLPDRKEFTAIWQTKTNVAQRTGFRISVAGGPDLQVTLSGAENMVKLETCRFEGPNNPDILAARPFKLPLNTWLTVKAVFKSDLFVVKLNGIELIRYPASPEELKPSERFYLYTQGETRFRQLLIREVRQTDYLPWGTALGNRSSGRSGGSCCRK